MRGVTGASLAGLAMLLGLGLAGARADELPVPKSPVQGHFTLDKLDGSRASDTDYRGKWMLIYFGYTFCPDVCPTTLSQIGAALKDLGPKADQFQPVFITLDPARDKQPVMAEYMKSFDSRIVALRGDPMDIEEAAKSYHVYYRPRALGNGQYTVDHSSYIYVIDPNGKFKEILTGDLPGHPLSEDLKKLAK